MPPADAPPLTLAEVEAATHPSRLAPLLQRLLGWDLQGAEPRLDSTRVQAPICRWQVVRHGGRWATLKTFFSADLFEAYLGELPSGGPVRSVAELRSVLWEAPFDPRLPGLARCMDGRYVASLLGGAQMPPLAARADLLRYRPEVSALLVYRDGSGEPLAFGKVSTDPSAAEVHALMERLWQSEAHRAGRLRLAEPLLYQPADGLLLQRAVVGERIGRERNRAIFLDLALAAADAAAALHAIEPPPTSPARSLDALLDHLAAGLDDLALLAPEAYQRLRRLLRQVEARAGRGGPPRSVLCHGDFKYDQLLEADGRFTLIDFDLFCRAEPSLDLGTFCAYVPSTTPEDWRDGVAAETVRAAFLARYERARGEVVDLDRLGLFEACMLAVRGLAICRKRRGRWEPRALALLDLALERLLDPAPHAPA